MTNLFRTFLLTAGIVALITATASGRSRRAPAVTDTSSAQQADSVAESRSDTASGTSGWVPTAVPQRTTPSETQRTNQKPRRQRSRSPSPKPASDSARTAAPTRDTSSRAPRPTVIPMPPPKAVSEPAMYDSRQTPPEVRAIVARLDSASVAEQVWAARDAARMGAHAAGAVPSLVRRLRSTRSVRLTTGSDSLGADSASVSAVAIDALGAIGTPAVPFLHRALNSNDAAVRRGACVALGRIRHGSSTDALLQGARDPDERVRLAAVEALGALRDPRAVPVLKSMSTGDESALVRLAAEDAHRGHTEVPRLIAGLRDSVSFVRDNSEYLLWLLTAKEFRREADQWELWWRQQQPAPLDTAKAKAPPKPSRDGKRGG